MQPNLVVPVKPLSSVGPDSAWAYWSLADGLIDGTSTTKAKSRAWGDGAVAVPDLTYAGTVGTLWTDHSGRAEFPDNGSNSLFSADLDAVTAEAFSFAGSGVLILWAHGHFDNDGTDTGAHAILQVANGGNSKNGFELQIHQSLRRVQVYGRSGSDVSSTPMAVGATNGLTAGTDATIAAVLNFGTLEGYCYVNGAASGVVQALTSGTLTLNASDAANFIALGGNYSGGAITTAQLFDGAIQRVGVMKCASMPSNFSEIMLELSANKGVPGRKMLAL